MSGCTKQFSEGADRGLNKDSLAALNDAFGMTVTLVRLGFGVFFPSCSFLGCEVCGVTVTWTARIWA